MALLQIDQNTAVDTDEILKVEFVPSGFLGDSAKLLKIEQGALQVIGGQVFESLPALQNLRQLVGDGSGESSWVRATTGDNDDTYVQLSGVESATLSTTSGVEVVKLKASGLEIGDVGFPPAVELLKAKFDL